MSHITLFLMTEKGAHVLKHVIQSGLTSMIREVVVGRDPAVANDRAEEIFKLAKSVGIKAVERSAGSDNWEYGMAISWRWIIPVTSAQRLIVLHDSLLPAYRGFAPLVSQLIAGETRIGVTALHASQEYDTGPLIGSKGVSIQYPLRISKAIELLLPLYADLTLEILECIRGGRELASIPQDESKASYSLWRDEEDYRICWDHDATLIQRFVDAVGDPYRGAFTTMNGKGIRIYSVRALPDVKVVNRSPGKLIFMKTDKPVVVCGSGLLQVEEAVFEESGKSIFPLTLFRTRFQ